MTQDVWKWKGVEHKESLSKRHLNSSKTALYRQEDSIYKANF